MSENDGKGNVKKALSPKKKGILKEKKIYVIDYVKKQVLRYYFL